MKHVYSSLALALVLSACSRPYDEATSAIPAGTADNPYYYGGEQSNAGAGNPYGVDAQNPYGAANVYGNGTPLFGGEAGSAYGAGNAPYSYNQMQNQTAAVAGSNNVAGAFGDYYRDPGYGVNVTGGPSAAGKDRVIYFSYDSSRIDARAEAILREHARYLKANPRTMVILEGHTDERGSREYNIALGERRAYSVKQQFQRLGVNTQQMRVLSYGEERPAAWGSNEASYAKNRRTVIIY